MSGQAQDTGAAVKPPVAANLCRFQRDAGVTNSELAERLGHRDDRQITRWRSGRVVPAWTTLVELAQALGVEPADFYADTAAAA